MAKCTVAIPVFNRERFIAACVASALASDLPELEVLVVDNQSTDRTWDILQSIADPRLRLERNATNIGMFGNFNRALQLATGDYLCFLCSDDRLAPGFLREAVAAMEANPRVTVFSGRGRRVNEKGETLGWAGRGFRAGIYPSEWAIAEILRFHAATAWNPLNYPSGVLLRRSAALAAGEFNAAFVGIADIDFMLRTLRGGDLMVTEAATCDVIVHAEQAGKTDQVRLSEIGDFFQLAERWRPLLEKRNAYHATRRDLGGYAQLLATLESIRGQRNLAVGFWALSKQGGSNWLRRSLAALLIVLRHLRISWLSGSPVRPPG